MNNNNCGSKLSAYARSTDFHGIRFIFHDKFNVFHRIIWLCMFLLALGGFLALSVFHARYYYSYPYTTKTIMNRSIVPAPAIAFCPQSPQRHVIMPNYTYWHEVSNEDFLLLLHFAFNIPIVTTDRTNGSIGVDRRVHNILTSIDITSRENGTFAHRVKRIAGTMNASRLLLTNDESLQMLVERVKQIPVNLTVMENNMKLRDFFDKFGFRLDLIQSCSMLSHRHDLKAFTIDCKPLMYEFFTDIGQCVAMNNDSHGNKPLYFILRDGGELHLHDAADIIVISHIHVTLRDPPLGTYTGMGDILFYQASELPSSLFRTSLSHVSEIKAGFYSITRASTTRRLGLPYDDSACSASGARIRCLHECLARNLDCVMLHIMAAEQLEYAGGDSHQDGVERVEQEDIAPRHCSIEEHANMNFSDAIKRDCYTHCYTPCQQTEYVITHETRTRELQIIKPVHLFIEPSFALSHEMYSEEALYAAGTLVADFGGTIGLFLGASVLTLAHLLEYMCTAMVPAPCCNRKDRDTGSTHAETDMGQDRAD